MPPGWVGAPAGVNLAVGWADSAPAAGAAAGGAGVKGTVFAPSGGVGATGGLGAGGAPGAGGGGAEPAASLRKVMRTVSFFKGTEEVLAEGFSGGVGFSSLMI